MSVKILHLADIHLGATQKFLPDEKQIIRSDEIFESFTRVIEEHTNADEPVDAILICGDLFDSPVPESKLLDKVESLFLKVEEKNIPIIIVPGNHDNIITPNSVYRKTNIPGTIPLLSSKIEEPFELDLKGQLFHFYGMAFSFLSNPPFDEFRPKNRDAVNIALIHGSVQNHENWQIHSQDIPLDLQNLYETGFDYIALGHYHQFSKYQQNGVLVVYPGSLEPLSWLDEKKRHVVVADFEDKQCELKVKDFSDQKKFYKTEKLNYSQLPINSSNELANYISKKFGNEKLIFKLILQGTTEFVPELLKISQTCENDFFYLKIVDETIYLSADSVAGLRNEKTIRGLAIRKLAELIKNEENLEKRKRAEESLKMLYQYFSVDLSK